MAQEFSPQRVLGSEELGGHYGRASMDGLNRRRPLSLAMIRALSIEWNLPADVLVRDYELTNTERNVNTLQTVGKSSSHG